MVMENIKVEFPDPDFPLVDTDSDITELDRLIKLEVNEFMKLDLNGRMSSPNIEVAAFEDVQDDHDLLTGGCLSDLDLGWLTSSDTSDAESDDENPQDQEEDHVVTLDVFDSLRALADALPERKTAKKTVQRVSTSNKQQLPQHTIQGAYEYIQYLKSEIELAIKGSVDKAQEGLQYKHKFSVKYLKSDKKEVKRPKNGFIRFSMEQRRQVAQQYPSMDNREISRILGIKWRKLPESTKRKYEQEFEAEMAEVKRQHPSWRYAGMRGHSLPSLVEPIPSRLRPREKLKRKFIARNLVRRPYRRKAHKVAATPTQWVQCDKCAKWRKLPPHVATKDLPDKWYCELNEGSENSCCIPQESDDDN